MRGFRIAAPIHLCLRPKHVQEMILEGDVDLDLIAPRGDVREGQYAPNRRLDIEVAPSCAKRHRGQVRPGVAGQRCYSGWCQTRTKGTSG
jgi:hypothetical protein